MKRVFLDTNIILDLLDSDRPNHSSSIKAIDKAITGGCEVVMAEDMLSTIFYITKNKAAALDFLHTIVDEWDIVSFGKETIRSAIDICQKDKSLDFEDILQCLCAKKEGCNLLVTNDKKFYDCGVRVVSSDGFVSGF